jgi:hypothetical protein
MTIIQPPVHELDSSCLTGVGHEYNFLVMNLTHPVLMLESGRMSNVLDQEDVVMSCSSQAG